MNRGKYQKPTPKRFPWLSIGTTIIFIALLVIFMLKGCNQVSAPSQENTESSTAATAAKNPDSIAIPGYEMLELQAGSKEQPLCLPNPPQNCCYFQIFLYLEDGTLLWQSELIEPGTISKPIVLSMVLEEGMYPNAVLRYSCYRMDEDLSPLNGAETKVTLWVK